MRRREFITLLGGSAAAWPLVARAQQTAMPVVGFLSTSSIDTSLLYLAAFRKGLGEAGFVEGQNVAIEYRWAEGQLDRLPELASDLVRRRVAVIATIDTPASRAAAAATATIPVVFSVGEDPVKLGLVASLARPGRNATGFNFFTGELTAKRLGLLHELVPAAARIGVLIDPVDAERAKAVLSDVLAAAGPLALRVQNLSASTGRELEVAFAMAGRERTQALFVGPHAFFNFRRVQIAMLAVRHGIPAAYPVREYADAGGLMSYGTSLGDTYRQAGVYAGRILKGAKPADLPVLQPTKFELVINLSTARLLDFDVPPSLLARADEGIE